MRVLEEIEEEGIKVHARVTEEEAHGEQRRDEVERTEHRDARADEVGEQQGALGLAGGEHGEGAKGADRLRGGDGGEEARGDNEALEGLGGANGALRRGEG